jgi:hypothetical protein
VRTQAVVNLHLLLEAWTTRCIDLYYQVGIVGVIDHRRIVSRSQQLPGSGELVDDYWVVGSDAFEAESGE